MIRASVNPALLTWARERASLELDALSARFPKLAHWEAGTVEPTLKQLEAFARATHAPVGFLFLPEPPDEPVPIPDLRTVGSTPLARPSPNLLETIYLCEERRDWYREYARATGERPLPFVGSATVGSDVVTTARTIRHALGFDLDERAQLPTFAEALRRFVERADALGILVMRSSVVANDNHRHLDVAEFRGFALADDLAPLVFINASDSKSAQQFTLAHEIAHLWLGQSALSDAQASSVPANRIEQWCNRVAAEVLVPLDLVRAELRAMDDPVAEAQRLAKRFKVSTLVMLRRAFDAGRMSREVLAREYETELDRLKDLRGGSGGNFYLTQSARVGERFARALVTSTLEGNTLFSEAHRMLGFSKLETFQALGRHLGVTV